MSRRTRRPPRRAAATHPAARSAVAPPAPGAPVEGATAGSSAPRQEPAGERSALVISYCFESGVPGGPPMDVRIRLSGRRVGGARDPRDAFVRTETITGVAPGAGAVAATAWVYDVNPGDWEVTAELLGPERLKGSNPDLRLPAATWSWRRWAIEPAQPARAHTRDALVAPLAATPAVLRGSFPVLAAMALAVALLVEVPVLARLGLDVAAGLRASLAGILLGTLAAKAWYMALKGPSRRTLREGWSVDGFLVAAPIGAAAAALAQGLAAGAVLDAAAPGVFIAVGIGRVGCFLTGCCAGRITAGHGVVSSDRRVVARRVPAQLYESATGVVLALSGLLAIAGGLAGSGLVLLAGLGIYAVVRQWLLRQRAERRRYSWARALPQTGH